MTTNLFKEKKAFIIGGSSGIGKGENKKLTQELIKKILFNRDIIELFKLN